MAGLNMVNKGLRAFDEINRAPSGSPRELANFQMVEEAFCNTPINSSQKGVL